MNNNYIEQIYIIFTWRALCAFIFMRKISILAYKTFRPGTILITVLNSLTNFLAHIIRFIEPVIIRTSKTAPLRYTTILYTNSIFYTMLNCLISLRYLITISISSYISLTTFLAGTRITVLDTIFSVTRNASILI